MLSTSHVPVAVAVHWPLIIEPAGIVIVYVQVLPFIVPETVICPPMWPGSCMVPENVFPAWVIVQVGVPIMPAPIIDPVESDAVPNHVPVIVAVEVGPVGDAGFELPIIPFELLPPQAEAITATPRPSAIHKRMKAAPLWLPWTVDAEFDDPVSPSDGNPAASDFSGEPAGGLTHRRLL